MFNITSILWKICIISLVFYSYWRSLERLRDSPIILRRLDLNRWWQCSHNKPERGKRHIVGVVLSIYAVDLTIIGVDLTIIDVDLSLYGTSTPFPPYLTTF